MRIISIVRINKPPQVKLKVKKLKHDRFLFKLRWIIPFVPNANTDLPVLNYSKLCFKHITVPKKIPKGFLQTCNRTMDGPFFQCALTTLETLVPGAFISE